jgi:hypothetical protein
MATWEHDKKRIALAPFVQSLLSKMMSRAKGDMWRIILQSQMQRNQLLLRCFLLCSSCLQKKKSSLATDSISSDPTKQTNIIQRSLVV